MAFVNITSYILGSCAAWSLPAALICVTRNLLLCDCDLVSGSELGS